MPGLYSPKAFMGYLTDANRLTVSIAGKERSVQELGITQYRKERFNRLRDRREEAGRHARVSPKNVDGRVVVVGDAFSVAPIVPSRFRQFFALHTGIRF